MKESGYQKIKWFYPKSQSIEMAQLVPRHGCPPFVYKSVAVGR